jgi:hypothetical protein
VEHQVCESVLLLRARRVELLIKEVALEVSNLLEMEAHVGGENRPYHLLADLRVLLLVEALHPIHFLLRAHQLEGGSDVVILQDTLVVVP